MNERVEHLEAGQHVLIDRVGRLEVGQALVVNHLERLEEGQKLVVDRLDRLVDATTRQGTVFIERLARVETRLDAVEDRLGRRS